MGTSTPMKMIDCPQLGLSNLDLPEQWHENSPHFLGFEPHTEYIDFSYRCSTALQAVYRCTSETRWKSVSPQWFLGELPFLNGLGSHSQTASTHCKEYNERPDQQTQHRPQHAVQKHAGIMGTLPKHIIWPAGESTVS